MFTRLYRLAAIGLAVAIVPLLLACGGGAEPTSTPAATETTEEGGSTPTAAATPSGDATPATPEATPEAFQEEELTFTSGPDTLYGTFMMPDVPADTKVPAALIISGSGPTDRDGNQLGLPYANTNLNFAQALAADGVASFRYDKLGSGQTGLGSRTTGEGVDFELFLDEARAAYDVLAQRPEVDPERIIIVGHSEGSLFAMILAQEAQENGNGPHGLVLAAPLGPRYLDVVQRQLNEQLAAAEEAGQLTAEQADALGAELQQIITSIREEGQVPETITDPTLQQLFNPTNAPFLIQADQYDPAAIAADLPPTMPVLVLRGEKDQQVSSKDVDQLMEAFQQAGNENAERVEIPDSNHLFKVVPGEPDPLSDYNNPDLPFSPDVVAQLNAFVMAYLTNGGGQ